MASQYITVETEDGPMPTYESTPEGQSRGAVVVVQEAFGITSHIESITVRLADAGWRALAPALFHRQGSPVFGYDDFSAVGPVMGQLSAAGITADVHAALDFLAADGVAPGATGIVGFCMGGAVSFYAATLRPLGAAVTFYGGGLREGRFGLPSLIELAPSLQTPWLGLYGDQDKGIPAEDVEGLREAARTHRLRPRSCATPTPSTGSTAMTGRASTSRQQATGGAGPSLGSTPTSAPESRATLSAPSPDRLF